MQGTLTGLLLEAHRVADCGRGFRPGRGDVLQVRIEHVAIEGPMGVLAFRLFSSLSLERLGCDFALAGAGPAARFERAEGQIELECAARRYGAAFSRPGNGPVHQVYATRFAGPGRIALGTDDRLGVIGALGALALRASPVEIAAALAGEPVEIPRPEVVAVKLFGRAPEWVSGDDVVLELERRFALTRPEGRVLEFHVIEPEGLAFAARWTVARRAVELGAIAGLFASDEAARRALRQQGREADWKPLAGDPDAAPNALEVDFSNLEPLLRGGERREVHLVRDRSGRPVDGVCVGPELPLEELARFAERFRGRQADPRVAVTVSVSSRQTRATAAKAGLIAMLRRAGIRVLADENGRSPGVHAGRGIGLACGFADATGLSGRWHGAGPETCAAAALAGEVVDPRTLPALRLEESGAIVIDDRLLVRSFGDAGAANENGERPEPPPEGSALSGPMRGVVLLKLGDEVGADRFLPRGARLRPLGLRVDALADFAFAGVDRGFRSRADAHGGGWIVAGRGFGGGPRREQVGLVAVRLGLRAILALGFDPRFRRMMLQHGILTLRFLADGDYADVNSGDELEISDLPEGLEAGKPLVVRNLTRGAQYALHHDLDTAGMEVLRAGGLLATTRRRRRTSAS